MDKALCVNIHQLVRAALTGPHPRAIEPALVTHIAECPACRGALLLLMAELLGIFPVAATITCDACQDDLAAFVDRERAAGAAIAAREYPQVWWHLWTCAECADTYDFVRAALELPPPAEYTAHAPPHAAPRRVRVLHLRRSFLSAALPVHTARLGAARGTSDEAVVISEHTTSEGRSMRLSVEEQADHDWCVMVEVGPVPSGWLILLLGEQTFRARFDARGHAAITSIPAELLTDANGPDLSVEIETDG